MSFETTRIEAKEFGKTIKEQKAADNEAFRMARSRQQANQCLLGGDHMLHVMYTGGKHVPCGGGIPYDQQVAKAKGTPIP